MKRPSPRRHSAAGPQPKRFTTKPRRTRRKARKGGGFVKESGARLGRGRRGVFGARTVPSRAAGALRQSAFGGPRLRCPPHQRRLRAFRRELRVYPVNTFGNAGIGEAVIPFIPFIPVQKKDLITGMKGIKGMGAVELGGLRAGVYIASRRRTPSVFHRKPACGGVAPW